MRNTYDSGDFGILENAFEMLVHDAGVFGGVGKTPLDKALHEIKNNAVGTVVNTDHGTFEYRAEHVDIGYHKLMFASDLVSKFY